MFASCQEVNLPTCIQKVTAGILAGTPFVVLEGFGGFTQALLETAHKSQIISRELPSTIFPIQYLTVSLIFDGYSYCKMVPINWLLFQVTASNSI
jgi:hypothetical protein